MKEGRAGGCKTGKDTVGRGRGTRMKNNMENI